MKVLVPLNDAAYMERLVEAGADELYLGFYDEKWFETFGEYADINRMSGFRRNANRYDFDQMISLAKRIKTLGRSAFVTMNANCYSEAQIGTSPVSALQTSQCHRHRSRVLSPRCRCPR